MVAIFWGVWIIIPVLFDGVLTLIYWLYIILKAPKIHQHQLDEATLPRVSIIIPTYNEQDNINECLNYLKIQTYPQDKMEIIVVDNGSTDATSAIVKEHMKEIWENGKRLKENGNQLGNQKTENGLPISNLRFPNQFLSSTNQSPASNNGKIKVNGQSYQTNGFGGVLRLVVRYEQGKAKALNSGIRLSGGEIIINIDCRSFLAPDAVYNMVAKFIEHPEYGAATGNVEIDWQLIYERDHDGSYLLDGDGHYHPRELSHKEKFLGKAQFMEYLTSFRLGRQFQDITGSMYTFSGAFSAFRREVLMQSNLYNSRTVAEDTDLTLDLQGQNVRLGFAEDAKSYLKPVISFERFYSQRIRWHRGQIEVIGLHLDWYGNFRKGFWHNFWLASLLMIDHTFSFPRIIWIFLLPLFFLFGYSMTLIIEAILLMYVFYVFIDFLNASYCYRISDEETREKIKDSIQYCLVTPIFRLITFYFRFAAYLEVLKEPQAWSTPINPVRSVKGYRSSFKGVYQKTTNFGLKVWQFISGRKIEPAPYYEEKIAELDGFGLDISSNTKPNGSNGTKRFDGIFNEQKIKERG